MIMIQRNHKHLNESLSIKSYVTMSEIMGINKINQVKFKIIIFTYANHNLSFKIVHWILDNSQANKQTHKINKCNTQTNIEINKE